MTTLVKTTLLPGQNGVTVVASLPTNPSHDVTANIPIQLEVLQIPQHVTADYQKLQLEIGVGID